MRVAFVGKGGSGKTTISSLFAKYLDSLNKEKIMFVDADINVHAPELLTGKKISKEKFLSIESNSNEIKKYLINKNKKIESFPSFRKTTPPGEGSNLIFIEKDDYLIKNFSEEKNNLFVLAVGTYESEGIGKSCYHNNLSTFEIILNHLVDKDNFLVADMVAGTDAFASSLHAQFDIIVLVIEPTRRSIEIYDHYIELAKHAGIEREVYVVANKVNSSEDVEFLNSKIPSEKIIGYVSNSNYIRDHDKYGGELDFNKIEDKNKEIFEKVLKKLNENKKDPNYRLSKIIELHKKYVSQNFIVKQFGDLTTQIDHNFKF